MNSYSDPKVSIIIPTYNEAENIEILIKKLVNVLESINVGFEILVVDDNSPDGTCSIVKQISRRDPRIKCILRINEKGLASAVVEGLRQAKGSYIVVMDADLQHPPEVVPRLLKTIDEGADLAVASRYAEGGGVEGWSKTRLIMSRVGTILVSLLIDEASKTTDPLSGFFAVRRDKIIIDSLKPKGFKILLEILVRHKNLRVVDVPYVFSTRYRGMSKLDAGVITDFLRVAWASYLSFKIHLLGLIGIVLYFMFVGLFLIVGINAIKSLLLGAITGSAISFLLLFYFLRGEEDRGKYIRRFVSGFALSVGFIVSLSSLVFIYTGLYVMVCMLVSCIILFLIKIIISKKY